MFNGRKIKRLEEEIEALKGYCRRLENKTNVSSHPVNPFGGCYNYTFEVNRAVETILDHLDINLKHTAPVPGKIEIEQKAKAKAKNDEQDS